MKKTIILQEYTEDIISYLVDEVSKIRNCRSSSFLKAAKQMGRFYFYGWEGGAV